MKKLSFLFISLLTAFAFTGCTDGLDNIEYNPSNGVILSAPVSAAATSSSLTVTSTMNGNVGVVLKKGFCYSANVQNPTIKLQCYYHRSDGRNYLLYSCIRLR